MTIFHRISQLLLILCTCSTNASSLPQTKSPDAFHGNDVDGSNIQTYSPLHQFYQDRKKVIDSLKIRGGSNTPSKNNSNKKSRGKEPPETPEEATTPLPLKLIQVSSFMTILSTTLVAFAPATALVPKLGSVEKTTSLLSTMTATAAIVEIVASPTVGRILDSSGRKPLFVGVLLAIFISQALVAITGVSTWGLCTCKVVSLTCSGFFFQTIGQAILSDLTASSLRPERLSSALGVQSALISLGFLFGAIGAGQLLSKFPLQVSYSVAAFLTACNLSVVSKYMPETLLSSSKQQLSVVKKQGVISSIMSSTRILTRRGKRIQILAIIFVLQCLPSFMGDFFQIYCKTEWNLDTKAFSSFVAMFGVLGLFANIFGSMLVGKFGVRRFTLLSSLLVTIPSFGASLFGFKGLLRGYLIGFLGLAQNLGIMAALVNEGKSQGIPVGELSGERAALLGLVKVVGPVLYSTLYVRGQQLWNIPSLPFIFNACLGLVVFGLCQLYL